MFKKKVDKINKGSVIKAVAFITVGATAIYAANKLIKNG